jgi:hypothetical protein
MDEREIAVPDPMGNIPAALLAGGYAPPLHAGTRLALGAYE